MSIGVESSAGSQYLPASHNPLHQSKKTSSEISKTYKHASQLYLTRRLSEAYDLLQPVIRPPGKSESHQSGDEEPTPLAPIALGVTSQRIKIWSLYVTLLNAVADLDPDEGRREFGSKEYGNIVRNVQSGDIWEQVVRDGYQGREDSVDAEVVYNLSNLLLAQAPNQAANQSRLETYLSSSSNIDLDIASHLSNSFSNGRRAPMSGASTPKDLTSRIKILELFTLHVLPRNLDWEYAKSFISNSDILDEEKREAFLQTLTELQEAKEAEQAEFTDAEEDFGVQDDPIGRESGQRQEEIESETKPVNGSPSGPVDKTSIHRRNDSEVDYGIDQAHPNGFASQPQPQISTKETTKVVSPKPTQTASIPNISSKHPTNTANTTPTLSATTKKPEPTTPPQRRASKTSKPKPRPSPSKQSNAFLRRASQVLLLFRTLSNSLSSSLSNSPAALMRTLMFIVGILAVLSRRDIRERMRRILEQGWGKIRGTVGMGVKVSYI